jgi:FtsX-like permease family
MNIMLVTVTERTREIGIRKAIEARKSDILAQFLLETVLISIAGGLIGVAAGIGGSRFRIIGVDRVVDPASVVLAFGVAIAVGLFFGATPQTEPRPSNQSRPSATSDEEMSEAEETTLITPPPPDRWDESEEELEEIPPRRRLLTSLTGTLLITLLIGLGFLGGVLAQKHFGSSGSSSSTRRSRSRPPLPARSRDRQGLGRGDLPRRFDHGARQRRRFGSSRGEHDQHRRRAGRRRHRHGTVEHGFEQDPKTKPAGTTKSRIDRNDPKVQAAVQACMQYAARRHQLRDEEMRFTDKNGNLSVRSPGARSASRPSSRGRRRSSPVSERMQAPMQAARSSSSRSTPGATWRNSRAATQAATT